MANIKISALPSAATVLPADLLPIVQGGVSKQSSFANLWEATPVGNVNYTILTTDTLVYTTTTLTATRTWTLPSAAAYGAGRILRLVDAFGAVAASSIDVVRAGTDTIDWGTTSYYGLTFQYSSLMLVSDGVSRWTTLAAMPLNSWSIFWSTTNDNAVAGKIGEVVDSGIVTGVALTTATAKTITSISLSGGDWNVYGYVGFTGVASTSVTEMRGSSSSVTDTLSSAPFTYLLPAFVIGAASFRWPIPAARFSLATTSTIYLVGLANFTAATMSGSGQIWARRER